MLSPPGLLLSPSARLLATRHCSQTLSSAKPTLFGTSQPHPTTTSSFFQHHTPTHSTQTMSIHDRFKDDRKGGSVGGFFKALASGTTASGLGRRVYDAAESGSGTEHRQTQQAWQAAQAQQGHGGVSRRGDMRWVGRSERH